MIMIINDGKSGLVISHVCLCILIYRYIYFNYPSQLIFVICDHFISTRFTSQYYGLRMLNW